MKRGLNLAARPFVNARPVVRATIALWLLGGVLLVTSAVLYWSFFAGREDQRSELAEIDGAIAAERAEVRKLGDRLTEFELAGLNARVEFLNQRIAERTFSWSLLFDRLADILPGDVRLQNLSPRTVDGDRRGGDASAAAADDSERVLLSIQAEARREEAILELLDALFADPVFEHPNLAQENRERGVTRFTLTVIYLPQAAAAAADAGEPAGADAGDAVTAGAPGPAAGEQAPAPGEAR